MADIINVDPYAGNQTPIDITNGQEIEKTTFAQRFERALNIVQKGIRLGLQNGKWTILGGNDGPMEVTGPIKSIEMVTTIHGNGPVDPPTTYVVVTVTCPHGNVTATYYYRDGDITDVIYGSCAYCNYNL